MFAKYEYKRIVAFMCEAIYHCTKIVLYELMLVRTLVRFTSGMSKKGLWIPSCSSQLGVFHVIFVCVVLFLSNF
jgi:hypothetical protein